MGDVWVCRCDDVLCRQQDGWIGTSLQTGFVSEVVLRVALELREAFPDILCHHELRSVWSKKCVVSACGRVCFYHVHFHPSFVLLTWLPGSNRVCGVVSHGALVGTVCLRIVQVRQHHCAGVRGGACCVGVEEGG